jgi:hypothetical protein
MTSVLNGLQEIHMGGCHLLTDDAVEAITQFCPALLSSSFMAVLRSQVIEILIKVDSSLEQVYYGFSICF